MRFIVVGLAALCAAAAGAADVKEVGAKRYQVEYNPDVYPQDNPKTALHAVLRAIENKRIDYLVAHLTDPRWVDQRVRLYDGNFEELVKEVAGHLAGDPTLMKDLKRIVAAGEWEAADTEASAGLKENKDKRVFFRKVGKRWFLENRQKAK